MPSNYIGHPATFEGHKLGPRGYPTNVSFSRIVIPWTGKYWCLKAPYVSTPLSLQILVLIDMGPRLTFLYISNSIKGWHDASQFLSRTIKANLFQLSQQSLLILPVGLLPSWKFRVNLRQPKQQFYHLYSFASLQVSLTISEPSFNMLGNHWHWCGSPTLANVRDLYETCDCNLILVQNQGTTFLLPTSSTWKRFNFMLGNKEKSRKQKSMFISTFFPR